LNAADQLSILYVAPLIGVCQHRAAALESLGHRVDRIGSETPFDFWRREIYRVGNKLDRPPDLLGTNRAICRAVERDSYDVLWIDKGRSMRPRTLAHVRRVSPRTVLLNYSPDDQMNPDNQSVQYRACIPAYDVLVTTKSYNVAELREAGAREVLFVDNAYDPATHRPLTLSDEDRGVFSAGLGFVGGYEKDRGEQMAYLAKHGLEIKIWGYHWNRMPRRPKGFKVRNEVIRGDLYAKAINATKINLGFLRKINRDLQTTRSIEIPACEAFMLAERTDEHLRLFEEGKEAEYFSSREELLQKCRYYLEHDEERIAIARAGRQRCLTGGYSNAERLRGVVEHLRSLPERR